MADKWSFVPKAVDYVPLIGRSAPKIDTLFSTEFRNNPGRSTLFFRFVVENSPKLGSGRSEVVAVRSSVIHSISYNFSSKYLTLLFRNGTAYRYLGVPFEIFNNFLKATSKGAYYNRFISGKYNSVKVK